MSMQLLPHDGGAAPAVPAVSTPTVPTPPTMVSVAAAASTLLLMDMKQFPSWNHSRTLRTTVSAWSGQERLTWPVVLFRKGKTRATPEAKQVLQAPQLGKAPAPATSLCRPGALVLYLIKRRGTRALG